MDEIIYHYCSVETFTNIINNRSFWLSDVYNTNDPLEINYLINQLEIGNLRTSLETFSDVCKNYKPLTPYVGCFSKEHDLLSQWRGYADDGYGLAIGFNPKYFERLGLQRYDVEYSTEQHIISLEEIDKKFQLIDEAPNNTEYYIKYLFPYLLKSKQKGYREEKEVRIWTYNLNGHGIKFRVSNRNLIFYMEVPLDVNNECSIAKIIKGPNCKVSSSDISFLLQQRGFKNIPIKSSQIKYGRR